jgi:hypothetical protein
MDRSDGLDICSRKWATGLTDAPSFEPIDALVV